MRQVAERQGAQRPGLLYGWQIVRNHGVPCLDGCLARGRVHFRALAEAEHKHMIGEADGQRAQRNGGQHGRAGGSVSRRSVRFRARSLRYGFAVAARDFLRASDRLLCFLR